MDAVDRELETGGGPYFLGEQYSLVDITFVPFLERIAASIAYYKGLVVRGQGRWPHLERWFDAMETRPAYLGTKSDYYTHVHDLPPQLGGCASHPDAAETAAAIDGVDGKSWTLPLEPLTPSSLEPHVPGDDFERDAVMAATKLVRNHEMVVKFALRGPGKPGPRPVSAPLADPTAIPALEHLDAADAGFRHIAHALLVGVEAKQTGDHPLRVTGKKGQGMEGAPVCAAATYFKDRVGVPRDLPFPAARQLRAHSVWLIDTLQAA